MSLQVINFQFLGDNLYSKDNEPEPASPGLGLNFGPEPRAGSGPF